jgi:hypothetical protein
VRELRQAVARAVTLGEDVLEAQDFFPDGVGPRRKPEPAIAPEDDPSLAPYESIMKEAMQAALLEHGSIRGAAIALGMPKSTFADRARQWNLATARPARGGRRRAPTPTLPVAGANAASGEPAADAQGAADRGDIDGGVASAAAAGVAANAALAGAYASDAEEADELVTGAVAGLERSSGAASLESSSGAASLESSSGAASLEGSPAVGDMLDDTVGLAEPAAVQAWLDGAATGG